jgi:hypothetical protein
MNEKFDYPSMKQYALTFFENEFVLDYAPDCYAKSSNKDEFIANMHICQQQDEIESGYDNLLNQYTVVLEIKSQIIALRMNIHSSISASKFEQASELRSDQKKLIHQLIDIKSHLESKMQNLSEEKSKALAISIIGEINSFNDLFSV